MNIQVQTDNGISGKTVGLNISELITLSNLTVELDTQYVDLANTSGDNDVVMTAERVKELTASLLKAVGFLTNITQDVMSLNEAAEEMFTHTRINMNIQDEDEKL